MIDNMSIVDTPHGRKTIMADKVARTIVKAREHDYSSMDEWKDETEYFGEEAYSYHMDNGQIGLVQDDGDGTWLAMIGDDMDQIADGLGFYSDEDLKDMREAQGWIYVMDERAAGEKYNPDGTLRSGDIRSWKDTPKKTAADEDLMPRPFEGEDPRWQHIGNGWNVSKDGREDYTKWYSNNYLGNVFKTYGGKWRGSLNGPSSPREFGPFNTAEEAMDVVDDWAHSVVEYEENAVSASKKRAGSHKLARGFHSRWNESDMYDFVNDAIDDINRRTYSDIMAENLNSYEGDDGEVYTFDIMSNYFTLFVEVDGTNVSISCEAIPCDDDDQSCDFDEESLDQSWDFDEDYSSRDLANDLFNIASDAEDFFIEMSE